MKTIVIIIFLIISTIALAKPLLPYPVPSVSWLSIFFESIDRKTVLSGLIPLKIKELNAFESEIRIWSGFGLQGSVNGGHPLDGIVINYGKQGFTFNHLSRCPGMGYEFEPSLQPAEFWSSLKENG